MWLFRINYLGSSTLFPSPFHHLLGSYNHLPFFLSCSDMYIVPSWYFTNHPALIFHDTVLLSAFLHIKNSH
jgi:hypothetical protein